MALPALVRVLLDTMHTSCGCCDCPELCCHSPGVTVGPCCASPVTVDHGSTHDGHPPHTVEPPTANPQHRLALACLQTFAPAGWPGCPPPAHPPGSPAWSMRGAWGN